MSECAETSGSDPLVDDSNERWYGTIGVGTPLQTFTSSYFPIRSYDVGSTNESAPVLCDTGSTDFFLPGPNCGDACDGHELYNPNSSSSAEALGRTFEVQYADGSMATGDLYTDTVSLGGFKVR